jgi:hypothetical protein
MEIIGLLGHQGVGKNYIAEKILPSILKQKSTMVIAFADHFKIDCICKLDIEYDKVFGKKDHNTRKILQKVGTEEGRNKFGDDIWIRITEAWIKTYFSRGIKRFIISDVRFQNEVDWIKSLNGLVIKINAPNRYMNRLICENKNDSEKIEEIKSHQSEVFIDKVINFDFEINNDENYDVKEELSIKLNN